MFLLPKLPNFKESDFLYLSILLWAIYFEFTYNIDEFFFCMFSKNFKSLNYCFDFKNQKKIILNSHNSDAELSLATSHCNKQWRCCFNNTVLDQSASVRVCQISEAYKSIGYTEASATCPLRKMYKCVRRWRHLKFHLRTHVYNCMGVSDELAST